MVSAALLSCVFGGQDAPQQLLIRPKVGDTVVYEMSMKVTGSDPFQVEGKMQYKVDKLAADGSKHITSTQKGMILRFGGGQEFRDDLPRTVQRKFGIAGEMTKSNDHDAEAELQMGRLFWPNLPLSAVSINYSWKLTDVMEGKATRVTNYKFTSVETAGDLQVAVVQFTLKESVKNGASATGEFRINLKDGWVESAQSKVENFQGEAGSKAEIKYTRIH